MSPDEFIEMVTSNEIEAVRAALVESPSLVGARAWTIGTTALHCASHRGFKEIVELLLQAGGDIHAREEASNTTPLHWAAEGGHPEIARMLVESGADLEPIDDWYRLGPLGWAAVVQWAPPFHEDKPATVAYLRKAGAHLDVFSAVVMGKIDDVKAIVAAEPEVLRRRMGFVAAEFQPLHLAVSRQMPDMVRQLLDLGADIDARTSSGVTPLALAVSNRDAAIESLLRERGATGDVSSALLGGDLASVAAHLTDDAVSSEIVTQLLFLATRLKQWKAVELLIRHGADPNARSKQLIREVPAMAAPLHVAAIQGAHESADVLLGAGANPNPSTPDGTTPLHLAAGDGHIETVRILLQHGADPNARDKCFNAPPLGWAEFGGHKEIVALLNKFASD